jgi:TRAP-type C4-dicarboxylate transport system permease small subunit
MILGWNPRPHVLVAIGLLGIAGYSIVARLWHPAILSDDLVRGLWYGICLGLEILGVVRLRKRGARSA